MVKPIGIMAGTPVDTAFGMALFGDICDRLVALPVSHNPEEQMTFQVKEEEEKQKYLSQLIREYDLSGLVVYCNSLSAAVDFDHLSVDLDLPIVTPMHCYRTAATRYSTLGIFSANAVGAAGIEKTLVCENPSVRVVTAANLRWVEAVEKKEVPARIVTQLGIAECLAAFEKSGVECIVLGCTHFPYFVQEIQRRTSLDILNPDEYLMQTLKNWQ